MFAEESPDWNLDLSGSVTCELCGEETATMHLLRVVDGTVSHTHLCPSCAGNVAEKTDGLALVLAVPSGLRHLGRTSAGEEVSSVPAEARAERFCGVCGTTLADLKESGMVGCANCYQVFAEHLQATLQDDTEPSEHVGKIPHRCPESDALRHEIMRLQRMLRELIACERFEEAAGVRDRLAELDARLEGGSS